MTLKHTIKKGVGIAIFAFAASSLFALDVKIDAAKTHQTIDNFAAADAWSGYFVGQYFDKAQKGQLAKWLFSQKIGADGNPEGIGLSMWRFNLGGGTLEQDGANIVPFQRRAESFLTKDGKSYDWGKCAGQMYFVKKAKEYGVEKLLLFSNTPPVQWTRNGQGYGEKRDNKANIKPDCYGKFADYMADVAKKFGEMGYKVDYISPINEPQVNWDSNRQEGSPWYISEMKRVFVELDRALTERNLDTQIYIGETAHPKYNYAGAAWSAEPARWAKDPVAERPTFIIKNFFDKNSPAYVGDLKHMPKFLSGHSYHSHLRNADMESVHKTIAAETAKYGVQYQQSEWCLLPHYKAAEMDGFTKDWYSDNKADIQTALLMARIMYSDFVNSQATAWGYWKGMEIKGDHALTGVYPANGRIEDGGVARANKLLWAMGNFSLFVRPEFKRVEMSGADNLDKVAGLAFVSPDGKRLVAVFVNSSFERDVAKISLSESFANAKARAFRTDANTDLGNAWIDEASREIVLAPRSITTVVFDL